MPKVEELSKSWMKSEAMTKYLQEGTQKKTWTQENRVFALVSELFAAGTSGTKKREFCYAALQVIKKFEACWSGATLQRWRPMIVDTPGLLWWDLIDMIASRAVGPAVSKVLASGPTKVDPLASWLKVPTCEADVWVLRVCLLHQLSFKDKTDADKLARYVKFCMQPKILGGKAKAKKGKPGVAYSSHGSPASAYTLTKDDSFFLKKAIGWALRQYSHVEPHWVTAFVKANSGTLGLKLSAFSAKEALKVVARDYNRKRSSSSGAEAEQQGVKIRKLAGARKQLQKKPAGASQKVGA
eukprot:TRINITY_DN33258_c0_g1_i2.p1 TRINITY_DN33258_c0_g1~~TRINITY_DN33258_c0_g1_i2.p1  ORF type:complete len:297 (+),score=36.76 TRINITY_DN33258_c0_g1_i2:95-985(+)